MTGRSAMRGKKLDDDCRKDGSNPFRQKGQEHSRKKHHRDESNPEAYQDQEPSSRFHSGKEIYY